MIGLRFCDEQRCEGGVEESLVRRSGGLELVMKGNQWTPGAIDTLVFG